MHAPGAATLRSAGTSPLGRFELFIEGPSRRVGIRL